MEYHLNVSDNLPVQGMRNLTGNFNTLVQDLSCGTRVDTNDRTADRGLSGTGLAYEGEGFSLVDVKRSIFYRFDCVIALAESDIYIFYLQ